MPLPDTTETITWTSSNTAVATVNSAGKVTGVKAGKVTITASAGGTELHTYTVFVRIDDGVYRIDCRDISSYLAVNNGPLENATTVLRAVSNDGLPFLRQLWRVTYLAGGYYVLRPLHNQNMALHAKNGVSDVTTIGYNNTLSGVPAENRWTIEFLNGGYVLKCQGDSGQMLRYSASHPGSTVYTGSYVSSVFWVFESVSSVPLQVLLLDTATGEMANDGVRYIACGETATLSDLAIAVSFSCAYNSNQSIEWSSYDSSIASVDPQTGEVTGLSAGKTTTIVAKHMHNGVSYQERYLIHVAKANVPVLQIRHYYDLGYDIRENGANVKIQNYNNEVAEKFEEIFGIKIIESIELYTSICDQCVLDQSHVLTSDTLETLCRHYPYCATTMNLRNDLFSRVISGDEMMTVVIWSGRKMSAYKDDRSNSLETDHSVVMTTYGVPGWDSMKDGYGSPNDTAAIFSERTNTLFHELSHQLGAPDHYCYEDWDENDKCSNSYCDRCVYYLDEPRVCIMGRDTSITDSVIYCENCFRLISEHIEDHHYPLSN